MLLCMQRNTVEICHYEMVTNLFFYLLKMAGSSLYNKCRNKELIGQSYLAFNAMSPGVGFFVDHGLLSLASMYFISICPLAYNYLRQEDHYETYKLV